MYRLPYVCSTAGHCSRCCRSGRESAGPAIVSVFSPALWPPGGPKPKVENSPLCKNNFSIVYITWKFYNITGNFGRIAPASTFTIGSGLFPAQPVNLPHNGNDVPLFNIPHVHLQILRRRLLTGYNQTQIGRTNFLRG